MTYSKMFYKASGAVGIREKVGLKRQVFQLTARKMSRAELEAVADGCISRLEAGSSVADAKAWGQGKVR